MESERRDSHRKLLRHTQDWWSREQCPPWGGAESSVLLGVEQRAVFSLGWSREQCSPRGGAESSVLLGVEQRAVFSSGWSSVSGLCHVDTHHLFFCCGRLVGRTQTRTAERGEEKVHMVFFPQGFRRPKNHLFRIHALTHLLYVVRPAT